MQPEQLQLEIERFFALGADAVGDADAESAFVELRDALNEGKVRAAEPSPESPTGWRVNPWVKRGILLVGDADAFADAAGTIGTLSVNE